MKIYVKSAIVPIGDEPDEVRREVARNPAASPDVLAELSKDPTWRVRKSVVNNPNTSMETFEDMAKMQDSRYRRAVAKSPLTPPELLAQLATDRGYTVRSAVAKNPNTSIETLEKLANDKNIDVVWNALQNPNADKLREQLYDSSDYSIASAIACCKYTSTDLLDKMVDANSPVISTVAANHHTSVATLTKIANSASSSEPLKNVVMNPNTPANLISEIYNREDLDKLPGVSMAIAKNPNTPVSILKEIANNTEYMGLAYYAKETLRKLHIDYR